jgi:hypothetical protein
MDVVKKGADGKILGILKDNAFIVGNDIEPTDIVMNALKGTVDNNMKPIIVVLEGLYFSRPHNNVVLTSSKISFSHTTTSH